MKRSCGPTMRHEFASHAGEVLSRLSPIVRKENRRGPSPRRRLDGRGVEDTRSVGGGCGPNDLCHRPGATLSSGLIGVRAAAPALEPAARTPWRLLSGVTAGLLRNDALLRHLAQAGRSTSAIEVQALCHITGRAPRMLGEELDDACLDVDLTGAGGRARRARAPSRATPYRASRNPRSCWSRLTSTAVEHRDLLFQPGKPLLKIPALSFEHLDHLLHARHVPAPW
jgi:hypothetical protein